MTDDETSGLLERYAAAQISATELRAMLGGASFGDVLVGLAKRNLAFPRANDPSAPQRIAAARELLFPGNA